MIDANKAFRDYATRVSFNMTLSRNQIWVIRCVMLDIEHKELDWNARQEKARELRNRPGGDFYHDNYVMGVRKLLSMGIVENTPEWQADEDRCALMKSLGKQPIKQYWGPSLQFTKAGECVIELLRIAGLIPEAAANANKKAKRRAA